MTKFLFRYHNDKTLRWSSVYWIPTFVFHNIWTGGYVHFEIKFLWLTWNFWIYKL